MRFHADLHVHSKYSRATSRDLDLEHLAFWGARKGIAVVATGDCVHPVWLQELKEKLVPAAPGLFRLKPEIEAEVAAKLPPSCRALPSFMLATEISTIYKKGEKTRKIHHLIYAPDFATVDKLAAKLASIGNIASDGRPILGLDSRNLLETALESGPDAYLVPAHIWTPWFAALGSQSGFDSIAECYGDLGGEIFAVETGLSSDPAMNWRISFLDRYRLTSNSDAHSPGKLGREATFFDCAPDYFSLRRALEFGEGYGGTVEFFPEEGKYHADGHRKCGVRLTPKETIANGGRCPVCGGALTIGVEHRVDTLADRDAPTPPPTAGEVKSLVPLPEIIGEMLGVGPSSKRVAESYDHALARLGPELQILETTPIDAIERAGSPLLAEAVSRLRAGKVIREAGYDGEYGVIRLFEPGELEQRKTGALLFDAPTAPRRAGEEGKPPFDASTPSPPHPEVRAERASKGRTGDEGALDPILRGGSGSAGPAPQDEGVYSTILSALDDHQRGAASAEGPLIVIAGPGSGKTRMLTHRIAHLVAERGVPAENCLAITFTRRAAAEMRERLKHLLPQQAEQIPVHTFHSLGLSILREKPRAARLDPGFVIAGDTERTKELAELLDVTESKAATLLRRISKVKRGGSQALDEKLATAIAAYSTLMTTRNWVDFDDLVLLAAEALQRDAEIAARLRRRVRALCVDEFQDLDEAQYRLLRLVAPKDICVIGDPDQAIYGFRGADASSFARFQEDYPAATTLRLRRNYRSSGTIVQAASQVIATNAEPNLAEIVREIHDRIAIHAAPTERAEAEFVVKEIEGLLGGHSFFSIDSGRGRAAAEKGVAFGDIAVLYRTEAQSAALVEAFRRSGMPFATGARRPLLHNEAVRALLSSLDTAPDAPLADALREAASSAAGDTSEPLRWLTQLADRCGNDRARFAEALALADESDFFDARADRVALLTMHAAKGLEFAVVFVVGLEDGIAPLRFGAADEATLAEERRLFYVAMTRAKDRLFLTRAEERSWRGKRGRRLEASPFLKDIEAELLRDQPKTLPRRRPELAQLSLF